MLDKNYCSQSLTWFPWRLYLLLLLLLLLPQLLVLWLLLLHDYDPVPRPSLDLPGARRGVALEVADAAHYLAGEVANLAGDLNKKKRNSRIFLFKGNRKCCLTLATSPCDRCPADLLSASPLEKEELPLPLAEAGAALNSSSLEAFIDLRVEVEW